MEASNPSGAAGASWLRPPVEQQGLRRYLSILRDRWRVVLLSTVLTTATALAYVAIAPDVYKAEADLLVTPASRDDANNAGLGLIRDSNDPTRDVSTASKLVASYPVAVRVKRKLESDETPRALLAKVQVEPVAQSSIVSVTAEGSTPEEAARLANTWAIEAATERTRALHTQLDELLPSLRRRVNALSQGDGTRSALEGRIAQLEALRLGPDPTVRVTTLAEPPERRSSPRPMLSLAAGIIAGLLLGLAAVFALQALDPRLRREEQLRSLWQLPILARVPKQSGRGHRKGALSPAALSPATTEAYRTLRSSLSAFKDRGSKSQSILVTGSSPSEGKTTTAINLAYSLAQAGHRVILIEADLRRPTVGAALGLRPRFGISSVLVEQVGLREALVTTEACGSNLGFLLVDRGGPGVADRLSLPTARALVTEAEAMADYVVIDSPPLIEITDALPLAAEASQVVIVARLGHSRTQRLRQLGEMLGQHGIKPTGVVLVGVERPGRDGYYYGARDPEPVVPDDATSPVDAPVVR